MTQQQQMNIAGDRSAAEIVAIGAGLAVVALGFLWGIRQVIPEWQPLDSRRG